MIRLYGTVFWNAKKISKRIFVIITKNLDKCSLVPFIKILQFAHRYLIFCGS